MINLIYQDEMNLVLGDPRHKYFNFKNETEHRKAVDNYINYVKKFIDKLPEKYKSVSNIYEEIKDCYANPDYCVGLVCLLYINILENEHILNDYYDNGLKKEDKEEFIKCICKTICLERLDEYSRGGADYSNNEMYNKELGFLKIYASIYAINEWYNNQFFSNKDCVKAFYENNINSICLENLSRMFTSSLKILNYNEVTNIKNVIDNYNLGIYEQIYLMNYLDRFTNLKNNIDEVLIKDYISFIKKVNKKENLYNFKDFYNLEPIKLNYYLDNSYLNWEQVYSLLQIVRYFDRHNMKSEINKILETFNTLGIYENYVLCKSFLYKNFEPVNKLFDIKFLDILYQIKDKTKEDIEICVKILNTIIKKIDTNRIIKSKYNYKVYDGYKNKHYYEEDNYIKFLEKAKDFNNNLNNHIKNSEHKTLGYNNIRDYKKEYIWEVYQYITKIINFIFNNNVIDNFPIFMELLDLYDNKTEEYISYDIKQMLINEGYLKMEFSYSLQKKLNR